MRAPFLLMGAGLLAASIAAAGTPPAGFSDVSVMDATEPTAIAYEPGSGNLFVLEKGGSNGHARVLRRAAAGGAVTTALDLSCVDANGERGLLGIAFDPDYLQGASSRWVYLYYTHNSPASGTCAISGITGSVNVVSRFLESSGTLSGAQRLLIGPVLGATNHNAGTLRFGLDKSLFVSMGDNDTDALANPASRDLNDLRGKILRINRANGQPLPDNPFFNQAGKRGEIWAWGLRNPFRFSVDPATGDPWIADVGEGAWEEIDHGVAGADYGYPCLEGNHQFRSCVPANPTAPALEYGHQGGAYNGNSITGGPVYRNGTFPAVYSGRLFFADYAADWIRTAAVSGGTLSDVQLFMPDAGGVVDMVQAPNGCLAYVEINGGAVHEVCYGTGGPDADGDGFNSIADGGTDCNDSDRTVYPGAPDLCDGKDNDCNDAVDEKTCADFGGVVNGLDLALLGRYFGGACNLSALDPVDYTRDGCIDGDDLAVLSAIWGCSGTTPICH